MKRLLRNLPAALLVAALLCSAWGGCLEPTRVPVVVPMSVMAFPALAALAALWGVTAALMRRWRTATVMAVALLACAPMLRITLPLNLHRAPHHGAEVTLLTLNTAYFEQHPEVPPNATLQYILDSGADVVALQEVAHDGWGTPFEVSNASIGAEQRARLDSIYPYRTHDNDDVGLMSRYPFTRVEVARPLVGFDMVDYYVAMEHHFAVAYDVHLPQGRQLRVLVVHLRSWNFSRRQRTLLGGALAGEPDAMPGTRAFGLTTCQLIERAYASRSGEARAVRQAVDSGPANVVVCGDFNDVAGSWAYRTVRGGDLRDAWADAGRGYGHTFNRYRYWLRIDHILYRGQMDVAGICRDKAAASDHYPQVVTFVLP